MKPALVAAGLMFATLAAAAEVRVERVPENGLQPDALADDTGRVHLTYLTGDPAAANIQYVTRSRPAAPWSEAVRVNSQPGSAIAVGTVRGPRLALDADRRAHVIWNGSSAARPKPAESTPLLYARQDASGAGFEPQRSLLAELRHLDGGASVACGKDGEVFVAFHAAPEGADDETGRGVFLVRSGDHGASFTAPRRIDSPPLGVCGCCALEAAAAPDGRVFVLYRRVLGGSERGMTLLTSTNSGATFTSRPLDDWAIRECAMTTARMLASGPSPFLAAWMSRGQIFLSSDPASATAPAIPTPEPHRANHPVLARQPDGTVLVAWTEGTGWQRGGAVAWQLRDGTGRPAGPVERRDGVPVWGAVAVVPAADGGFSLFY